MPAARRAPTALLAIILSSYLMIVLDISIVITALPQIHEALGFSATGLSWVQSAYTLAFGGFLLLGARAGDILGRRRMFMIGIAVFTGASLAAGLAQSSGWLLAARAVQGLGAAMAAPSTLALLTTSFPEGRSGRARSPITAPWPAAAAASASCSAASSPSWLSWRWGLFINVPIGIAVILAAPRYLPETERRPGHFDLAGAATSTLGMTALVYGIVRSASRRAGPTAITVASIVAGLGSARDVHRQRAARRAADHAAPAVREPRALRRPRRAAPVRRRDVRHVLLPDPVPAGRPRLQPDRGGRRVPADDSRDVRDGVRRAAAHSALRLRPPARGRRDARARRNGVAEPDLGLDAVPDRDRTADGRSRPGRGRCRSRRSPPSASQAWQRRTPGPRPASSTSPSSWADRSGSGSSSPSSPR